MNTLIIFCHPDKQSYTGEMFTLLKTECLANNWAIEVSDLYAMNFHTDMSLAEYKRESSGQVELPISEEVLREHKKIEAADAIFFLSPLWWGDCPAKLKGWFDRVYSVGYAYKQSEGYPRMKTIQYGLAICTAGYTVDYLKQSGMAQSIQTIMLHDRLGQRFQHKEMLILGGTLDKENVRAQHTTLIKEAVEKMKNHF